MKIICQVCENCKVEENSVRLRNDCDFQYLIRINILTNKSKFEKKTYRLTFKWRSLFIESGFDIIDELNLLILLISTRYSTYVILCAMVHTFERTAYLHHKLFERYRWFIYFRGYIRMYGNLFEMSKYWRRRYKNSIFTSYVLLNLQTILKNRRD